MTISRRNFLKGLGVAGAVVALPPSLTGCADDEENFGRVPRHHFRHGVASGDPLADRVIIWTRFTSQQEIDAGGKSAGEHDVGPVDVLWEVALDRHFANIVREGDAIAEAARDYTVKVDVTGLDPEQTYYYRFIANEEVSPMGRMKTAPVGDVSHLRFAVSSCASGAHGYFNAYTHMAQEDLDAVIFLGDYIYEYPSGRYGSARDYDPPHEIISLEDYRRRHAWYKADEDLQAVHQQHPFICVWDDHELADNTWDGGANNHNPDQGEGDFFERRDAAQQAYSEWIPVRDQADGRIWRDFKYGNLVDLIMLDTRMWARTEQGEGEDEDRHMLGEDQEAWMNEQLLNSNAQWKFLGQQVMFGQLILGSGDSAIVLNDDQWDGYQAARERVYDSIRNTPGGNVVILTGDIHTAFANDVAPLSGVEGGYNRDTGEGSIAVEFVCTSISSPGLDALSQIRGIERLLRTEAPHIKYIESGKRGYNILDIQKDRVQSDYFVVSSIRERGATLTLDRAFKVDAGEPHLKEVESATPARRNSPPKAPIQ